MQNQPAFNESVRSQDSEVTQNQQTSQPNPASSGTGASSGSPPKAVAKVNETGKEPPEGEASGRVAKPKRSPVAPASPAPPDQEAAIGSPVEVEPIEKEKSVSKSIRLWKKAFDALRVLMGKYGMNMVDMASTAILAYAVKSAAAPIARYRIMDWKSLFALQASATDIKAGLSTLGNDLYKARKSHRDPVERKAVYSEIGTSQLNVLADARETLRKMDKEILLHDLLEPGDYELLVQAIVQLKASKPRTRAQRQIRDLYLKIFETLIL